MRPDRIERGEPPEDQRGTPWVDVSARLVPHQLEARADEITLGLLGSLGRTEDVGPKGIAVVHDRIAVVTTEFQPLALFALDDLLGERLDEHPQHISELRRRTPNDEALRRALGRLATVSQERDDAETACEALVASLDEVVAAGEEFVAQRDALMAQRDARSRSERVCSDNSTTRTNRYGA